VTIRFCVPIGDKDSSSGITLQARERSSSALAELQHAEPANAIWWLMALRNAVDGHDDAATNDALAHLASSDYYDDHAAELLKAQLELFHAHPLPAEFFAAVARLDPGWRLNGEFSEVVAPYYENQYPFANTGINNLFFLSVEAGMHELFMACNQQSDLGTARKSYCLKSARLLATRARRVSVREEGAMLLSQLNDFESDDVERARAQQWIHLQYSLIHPHGPGVDTGRPYVRDDIAFIKDWMESADECEAMKRAVVRAERPLQPPEDFHLDEALYGNFERARRIGSHASN